MPGPDLIQNPGFETGDLTDWTVTDPEPANPDIGVDSQPLDINSGNYGLFAGNQTTTLSQTLATTPGHAYTITFDLDVYQSAALDGGVLVTFGGQTAFNLVEPAETDAMVAYTATLTATASQSTLEFTFTDPGGYFGLDDVSVVDDAACYLRGTRLLTSRGEVAIEALAVGDLLVTASGALRPVRWLGRRALDCARHCDPASVWPVRVRAGAFGDGLPHRDLWLSPGHNIVSEGVLLPVLGLVNGLSVAQVEAGRLEYWHVELDAHDIVLAEGLPAESYLDAGNRNAFDNGGAFVEAHPDFRPRHAADTCLPLALEGPAMTATRARLLARVAAQGFGLTHDADPHILVDGRRVEPMWLGRTRLAFALPPGGREIALHSRAFIPAHVVADTTDPRALGLCVGALQIDGAHMTLSRRHAPMPGWHEAEFDGGRFLHRWTDGAAPLRPGARVVIVDLAGEGTYRVAPEAPVQRAA